MMAYWIALVITSAGTGALFPILWEYRKQLILIKRLREISPIFMDVLENGEKK